MVEKKNFFSLALFQQRNFFVPVPLLSLLCLFISRDGKSAAASLKYYCFRARARLGPITTNIYLVLLVPDVGRVQELEADLVVLPQPLDHKGLEPTAKVKKQYFLGKMRKLGVGAGRKNPTRVGSGQKFS